MVGNGLEQQLHDRATRGEVLSADEQMRLDVWYTAMDRLEAAKLGLNRMPEPAADELRIEQAVTRISIMIERIRMMDAENHMLRKNVVALRQRLARGDSSQGI